MTPAPLPPPPPPGAVIVAVDGPAGSGKSTAARALASRLGFRHLDTGAMYRAATYAVLRDGIDPTDATRVGALTRRTVIEFDGPRVAVDGVDVTEAIRGPEVSAQVSIVSAHPDVRSELRDRQRRFAGSCAGGCVVEGRDIGTVVFPDAALKVYLTARPEVRARRRAAEHGAVDDATVARWAGDIVRRDQLDSTRADSPLVAASDAYTVDTSDLDVDSVVGRILEHLP